MPPLPFQKALDAFISLPVASMSSDGGGCLGQLRVQTALDAAAVAASVGTMSHKASAAFRLGLYDVVASLVAIMHDACRLDATAVALSIADGRRGGAGRTIDPAATLIALFHHLDDVVVAGERSAASYLTTGRHATAAHRDLLESFQLLGGEEAVKLELGAGLMDLLFKILMRSVDYAPEDVGGKHSKTPTRGKHSGGVSQMGDRRRALLNGYELHRAAPGTIINLIQHCNANKDRVLPKLCDLLHVIEVSEDFCVQVMCVEILFRVYFHQPSFCSSVISGAAASSSSSPPPVDGENRFAYLCEALRALQAPSAQTQQDVLVAALEHVIQLIVARRQERNDRGISAVTPTLHLDAVGVDAVRIANTTTTQPAAASSNEDLCQLSGPTVLHFNVAFVVFRLLDGVTHVTIPYADVRSVRISRNNKVLISLKRTPDVVAEALSSSSSSSADGTVGIRIHVTAARVAQLQQSSVLDWITQSKPAAAAPPQPLAAAASPTAGESGGRLRSLISKRPRSASAKAEERHHGTTVEEENEPPRPSKGEVLARELQARVQKLVDEYRRDMSERRELLETTQRRTIEDFSANLRVVRGEARHRVDFINERMESIQSTWEALNAQELPSLQRSADGFLDELKAIELARVKELKVKVDASLSHVSDTMNRLVEQGELYMLQNLRAQT